MGLSKNARVGKDEHATDILFALPKHNFGSGAGFCSKRETKGTRGSQTAGSIKSEECKANYVKKHMAKAARSYKHRDYLAWLKKFWMVGYNGMSFEEYKEKYHDKD